MARVFLPGSIVRERLIFVLKFFRGVFNIYVKTDSDSEPRLVGKYDNAGSFGELALMYNLPRAATIQAVTPGALWAMDRQTFRRILLKSACKKRKMYESLLENVPMLKTLEVRFLELLYSLH